MLRAFPNPVLAVTHDVLRDIDGDDALSSLWFLFAKCKGGLHDGQRLENISWRLWHRELSDLHPYRPPTPDSPAKAQAPISFSGSHPPAGRPATKSRRQIGRVIDDISAQAIGLQPRPTRSHLPTPTTEAVSIAIFAAPDPSPASPPRRTAEDSGLPRVVVVVPSPHPTPPPSPVHAPTCLSSVPLLKQPPSSQLPPPQSPSAPRQLPTPPAPMPATPMPAATLKPTESKFYTGSPSSSSSSSSSSDSSGSTVPDEERESTQSSTCTDIPPSLSRTETLPAGINQIEKISPLASNAPRPALTMPKSAARQPRASSAKERERMDAEDRDLAEQHRLELEGDAKRRQDQQDKERLMSRELDMHHERQWHKRFEQQQQRDEQLRENNMKELQRIDQERQREREKQPAKVQSDPLRRTASTGHLPTQDSAIFDFTEEAQTDVPYSLQPSGSSHPELNRTVFGLNRALSPPKPSSAITPSNKGKGRETLLSAGGGNLNLHALVKEKAAARVQSNLRGAFTPMLQGSPTKSDSSKTSSSRHSRPSPSAQPKQATSGLAKAVVQAQASKSAASKPAAPPSVKGKEKAGAVTNGGRQIMLVSDDDDESDEDWTSADEDEEEEEPQVQPRLKAVSHSPPPAPVTQVNHRTTRNRRGMPADMQKHLRMDDLHHAFEEAERQKETFTFDKLPKRSYSNLSRTNSGLLSQLMHPDPQVLPEVYRRGYSSSDLRERPRSGPPGLHPSQSAAVLPVAAQVSVGSVREGGTIRTVERERRRPQEHEMEDESEGEDNDNSVPLSKSVAQEKLKAIFGNLRGGGGNANANTIAPIRPQDQQQTRERWPPHRSQTSAEEQRPPTAALERTMTEPITVPSFPYNLPVAAIPVSPRTTRQLMLRTEMSESVRANLLWQRQQDKQAMPRRNKSSAAISQIPSVVKLTEKRGSAPDGSAIEQERDEARNEIRRVNLMRNKSWAADYHPQ